MEVYAGYSEYTDAQVGRIIDYLEKTDQIDNTVIIWAADNGASGEGSPNGSVNENKFFNGYPGSAVRELEAYDKLGSPDTYEHYPTGWAAATSAPFKMFKRYSKYAGGTCDRWYLDGPRASRQRARFATSTTTAPTSSRPSSRSAGWRCPRCTEASSNTRSRACRCATPSSRPSAPTQKKRRYFAMLGTRAMWEDGWKAVALHAPITGKGHFDKDVWELYHTDVDPAESKNLAEGESGKTAGAHQGVVRRSGQEPGAAD